MFANIDLYILAFSAVTVAVTIWMGFRSAKKSKTASDFFVAGRSVSVGWNASAISGEYLSAASFMGIAGMVMSSGYDALWYPVCYACGYLFLLLFIAGPLRRFGAYTIPDFAEGRFDSPVFRKIAVIFVLFIGFFYTMPQMKGAGTTLAYIFPGLPYWVGVLVVGAVITLNVALGGMKGITLVQAVQYWAKMFAISVPIFVLMAVYGHYGKQVGVNGKVSTLASPVEVTNSPGTGYWNQSDANARFNAEARRKALSPSGSINVGANDGLIDDLAAFGVAAGKPVFITSNLPLARAEYSIFRPAGEDFVEAFKRGLEKAGVSILIESNAVKVLMPAEVEAYRRAPESIRFFPAGAFSHSGAAPVKGMLQIYAAYSREKVMAAPSLLQPRQAVIRFDTKGRLLLPALLDVLETSLRTNGVVLIQQNGAVVAVPADQAMAYQELFFPTDRRPLPAKAPADAAWLNPFGPLTTKAAKTAAAAIGKKAAGEQVRKGESETNSPAPTFPLSHFPAPPLRTGLAPDQRMTVALDSPTVAQALGVYAELTGRQLLPNTNSLPARVDDLLGGKLSALKIISRPAALDTGVREHGDGAFTAAEVKAAIEAQLRTNGLALVAVGEKGFRVVAAEVTRLTSNGKDQSLLTSAATAERAWLAKHEKPLALLYTYSLIIAIVCGTAGLPHILVRFYTNPDGAAAKRTTMWVMILIGVFYVFPPVFGALGRNILPDLYNGVGAKGTDKIVLELPRLLNAKYPPLGSILSGITCAGAFAAFMSTFSGLLVSMTGALAHDVYGRILRPKSTPEERMRMFKWCAVLLGGVAVVLGSFVEPLEINFMVGQAFAIAAASYFPLLFMSVWWRGMTMKGAAVGMLAGGTCALFAVALTNFSNLALDKGPMGKIFAVFAPLNNFWADNPLLRILCEQPAIWTVPLAITLMIVVSKLTRREVPADSRMKMLVLHAPEELGLKQEYIQEHQAGH